MANVRKIYDQFYESNGYGIMEVIGRDGRKLHLRFVTTGYETTADAGNVLAGKVRDFSVPKCTAHDWQPWDEEFTNNAGYSGKIISKKSKKCVVQFYDTGYTAEVHIDNVRMGKISDPYSKTFLGIGYLGEYELLPYWKQAKQLWSNMMKRCYNPKDAHGYFGKCFVDTRWHCFANFLSDISSLDNFDSWLEAKQLGTSPYNLDKDLKFEGNKVYSREACIFATEFENKSAASKTPRTKRIKLVQV